MKSKIAADILNFLIYLVTGMLIGYAYIVFSTSIAHGQNLQEKDFETVLASSYTNVNLHDGNPLQVFAVEYSPSVVRAMIAEPWSDSVTIEMNGKMNDTLSFLVNLSNNGTSPEMIYLGDLGERIYLENEKGRRIYPFSIDKQKSYYLVSDENLFVKFQIGSGSWHWTDRAKEINLVIDVNEQIKLKIK